MRTVCLDAGMRWRRVRDASAGRVCRMLELFGILADEETSARYDALDIELEERERRRPDRASVFQTAGW
jgi:hypothetical protein